MISQPPQLPTKLIHYAAEPLTTLLPVNTTLEGLAMSPGAYKYIACWGTGKPKGLWVSVEDYAGDRNWKEWCITEEFCLGNLACEHAVTLKKDAKILHLNTLDKMIQFSQEFGVNLKNEPLPSKFLCYKFEGKEIEPIYSLNWMDVAKRWGGIIIAPYMSPWGTPLRWYCGWDCASGCIWNIDAIEEVKLVKDRRAYIYKNNMP